MKKEEECQWRKAEIANMIYSILMTILNVILGVILKKKKTKKTKKQKNQRKVLKRWRGGLSWWSYKIKITGIKLCVISHLENQTIVYEYFSAVFKICITDKYGKI